jgi:hypothetical protein
MTDIPNNPTANNPLRMVHDLKGAPLSIIVVMKILRRPVMELELIQYCGYDKGTITKALRKLTDPFLFGIVARVRGGWSLAENVQLPLSWGEIASKSGDSPLFSTTTTIKELIKRDTEDSSSRTTKSGNFPLLENASPEERERWAALKKCGIFYNRMTAALIKLEHVTPEYIAAKADEYKNSGRGGRRNVGLLITAIGANEPLLSDQPEETTPKKGSFSLSDWGYSQETANEIRQEQAERIQNSIDRFKELLEIGRTNLSEEQEKEYQDCLQIMGHIPAIDLEVVA